MEPYLRFIGKFHRSTSYPEALCAYDHRLFCVESGCVRIRFGDGDVELRSQMAVIFSPGIPYRLLFEDGKGASYYILNFDFDSKSVGTAARPPEEESLFCRERIFSLTHPDAFASPTVVANAGSVLPLLERMDEEHRQERPRRDEVCAGLLSAVLVSIDRQVQGYLPPSEHRLAGQIKQYMREHLDMPLSNRDIAEYFGYHAYYLNALFVKHEGITLHRFLIGERMQRAKQLLSGTDLSVSQIAEACGFSGLSYFTETFTRQIGFSPSQYRRLGR